MGSFQFETQVSCKLKSGSMAGFQFPDVYAWISHLSPPSMWTLPSCSLPLFEHPSHGSTLLIAERNEDGCVSFFFDSKIWGKVCLKRDIKWSNEEDSNKNNMQVITSPLLSFSIDSISHAVHHPRDFSYALVTIPGQSRLKRTIKWINEEEESNNLQVIHSLLSSISHKLHLQQFLYAKGIDLSTVTEDSFHHDSSIAQLSNYPLFFNSAFACMCILIEPLIITISGIHKFISPEILHRELALAIGVNFDPESLIRLFGSFFTYYVSTFNKPSRTVPDWKPLSWSYVRNTSDYCEVKVYCPLLSMEPTDHHSSEFINATSEHLQDALAFQQLQSIIQLHYNVKFKGNFLHLDLGIHNVRCDRLTYENVPPNVKERDLISTERYFPSKISITLIPQHPSSDLTISINQSSVNPMYQIAVGSCWEATGAMEFGVKVSATTTSTTNIHHWKFEQSAQGVNGTFKWILYDSSTLNGKEVISSKPSKHTLFDVMSTSTEWYRDRYSKACSPFTEEGGVVFASDRYGKRFTWTSKETTEKGENMICKIEGSIWLTYWPNVHKTLFYENRCHHFCEVIELPLARKS